MLQCVLYWTSPLLFTPMPLSDRVLGFINDRARTQGIQQVDGERDLFLSNVLDSFSFVDLISMLESEYSITIPDADVFPANFQTLESIERYLQTRGL